MNVQTELESDDRRVLTELRLKEVIPVPTSRFGLMCWVCIIFPENIVFAIFPDTNVALNDVLKRVLQGAGFSRSLEPVGIYSDGGRGSDEIT